MKTKRILSMILAVMMLLCTLTAGMTVNADGTVYSDVTEDMWSYGDIVYVTEHGLMNGTGGSTFSPAVDVTRSMVVTVLYRMEGSPAVEFDEYAYADVADGEFYFAAVIWARESGIVTSVGQNDFGDDLFAPTRAITRQELATMFVRYAEYRYVITEKQADLSGFKDIGDVADWASKAMAWCNEAGLINGTGNGDTLSPKMTATREQFAAIIHRFREAELEYEYVFNAPKPLSTYTEHDYPLVDNADVYVAVDGSDSNPGTLEKPLATFEAAVAKVRELKKTAADGIVVAFKAGNYGNLTTELTEADAGSEKVSITYCKYGDGDVIFSNGINVSLDEFTAIDESEHYLFPAKAVNDIKKADLSAKLNGVELISGSDLSNGSKRLNVARFPNKMTNVDNYMDIGSPYTGVSIQLSSLFASRFDKYHTYENILMLGTVGHEYWSDYEPIKSYDSENKVIELYDGPFRGISEEQRVYVQNISEELDCDNEYWVDAENNILYVYKPNSNYTLTTKGTFIDINGADNVKFKGLKFKNFNDSALKVNADGVTVELCEFFCSGAEYVIYSNGYNNVYRSNEMYELAGGGIIVYGGDWENLIPSGVIIDNNLIHDYEQTIHTYKPAVRLMMSVGTVVSHNEIYNAPHSAIIYGQAEEDRSGRSIDNVIEYNYIHNVMNSTYADAAVIYCGRTIADRGNIIQYNIMSNCGTGRSTWSIYLDDGMAGQTVRGNVFYNAGAYMVMAAGRENQIYDNVGITSSTSLYGTYIIRYEAKYYDMLKDEGVDRLWSSPTFPSVLQSAERIPAEGTEGRKLWEERWSELFTTIADLSLSEDRLTDPTFFINPAGVVVKNNYIFSSSTAEFDFSQNPNQWFSPALDVEGFNNVIENNPVYDHDGDNATEYPEIFKNPALGDYSIREGSEFTGNIPFDEIGRY